MDLKKGDVVVFPMWLRCHGEHDREDPLRLSWVRFDYRDAHGGVVPVQETWENEGWPLRRRPRDFEFIEKLTLRSIDALQDPSRGRSIASKWLESALLAIHEQDQLPALSPPEEAVYERIRAICADIQAHPERPWHVEDLAEKIHYSPNHFARLFRSVQKVSPKGFIVRTRINTAKSMLRGSCHPINRIADLLGYTDVYHFSKQFKQKVGVSPSDYRERG